MTRTREERAERVMRRLAAKIAQDIRRTMREYHELVDGCGGMQWRAPDGHNECERCGIVVYFSAEEAYGWLSTLIQPRPIAGQFSEIRLIDKPISVVANEGAESKDR
jgi:hypothetical protein